MTRLFGKRNYRQTRNVLLVERTSPAKDRHVKTLARNGYEVITADTIESAQELYTPHKFDLVVLALDGFASSAAAFCDAVKRKDSGQVIALIFHPDHELPATDCPTLIFTTEPDDYFLARVETLTAAAQAI